VRVLLAIPGQGLDAVRGHYCRVALHEIPQLHVPADTHDLFPRLGSGRFDGRQVQVPQGALVMLNDEEIGESPTSVSFEWYGDYNVRISKEGYETLKTHRELKGPWYDGFPFDFFAQMINPNRIVDSYEWTFELEPKRQISRQDLIQNAQKAKEQLQ